MQPATHPTADTAAAACSCKKQLTWIIGLIKPFGVPPQSDNSSSENGHSQNWSMTERSSTALSELRPDMVILCAIPTHSARSIQPPMAGLPVLPRHGRQLHRAASQGSRGIHEHHHKGPGNLGPPDALSQRSLGLPHRRSAGCPHRGPHRCETALA